MTTEDTTKHLAGCP